MALKTYYWNTRKVSQIDYLKHKWLKRPLNGFKYGNVGDIFNEDLINYLYNEKPFNTREASNKLLLVVSVASVIKSNDIICGIGWKGNDLSALEKDIEATKVYGVRGPLTKTLFEKYNADLSDFSFQYDPGLLIKDIHDLKVSNNTEDDVLFIPHFNDENVYHGNYPEAFKILNVDAKPKAFSKAIMKAKIVYTSSLHGIIFSHALKKPCVFVAPQSQEPLFKYQDYFLSIGQEMPEPIKNINAYNFSLDKPTFLDKDIAINDFRFPEKSVLINKNIIF